MEEQGWNPRRERGLMRKEVREMRIRAIALGAILALLTATQACVAVPAYPPPPYRPYYSYEPYYGPYPYYAPFSFGFSYRSGGRGHR